MKTGLEMKYEVERVETLLNKKQIKKKQKSMKQELTQQTILQLKNKFTRENNFLKKEVSSGSEEETSEKAENF